MVLKDALLTIGDLHAVKNYVTLKEIPTGVRESHNVLLKVISIILFALVVRLVKMVNA